jgi:uncharacterized membrane protein
MHRTRIASAALAGALVLVAAACQHDLGTLGGRGSDAYGINDAGSVVGQSGTGGTPNPQAFVSNSADDSLSPISVSDELSSRAWDVNNHDEVVGTLVWPGQPVAGWVKPGKDRAVQRLYSGIPLISTGPQPPEPQLPYETVAINDKGIAVGYVTVLISGRRVTHAARWDTRATDPVAALTDLTPGSATASRALGIGENGEIVGWMAGRAWVWEAGSGFRDLPGGNAGDDGATGINRTGEIVGWITTPQTNGARRMAHWKGDKLTVLPGYGEFEAQLNAVNDDGLAAGNARNAEGQTRALRVDLRGGTFTDLGAGTARGINAGGTAVGESGGGATYWTKD